MIDVTVLHAKNRRADAGERSLAGALGKGRSVAKRKARIGRSHALLIVGQVPQFGISRGGVYYLARAVLDGDLTIMPCRRVAPALPVRSSRLLRDLLRQGPRQWLDCIPQR
jgi:hypothetical protein